MKVYFNSSVSIKGSSVYYDGKRLNHSELVELCAYFYKDLKLCYYLFENNFTLRPALLWHELSYKGLLAIVSRLILDSYVICDTPSCAFEKYFGKYAKFPSFLKDNKKQSLTLEFCALYFADNSSAGCLYDNKYFPKFSALEEYARGVYPSYKYDIEFIENSHAGV